jgi:acyl-CoA reductase-like NAD-dependent aldehyde dehydrogenase
MKFRSALALLLACPVISTVLSATDTAATPASPPPAGSTPAAQAAGPENEKKTDLEVRMDRMGKAFRKLKKQVADPAQNESSLELLATMEDAANEAIGFTPEKAEDIPVDQRAKFVEDFKAGVRAMQDEFAKLRAALTAGKNDDAVRIVAEMVDLEKKDHKEFRRPEKD